MNELRQQQQNCCKMTQENLKRISSQIDKLELGLLSKQKALLDELGKNKNSGAIEVFSIPHPPPPLEILLYGQIPPTNFQKSKFREHESKKDKGKSIWID
ncbi:hypothetical protein R6Q59_015647 [Mikania micrantha]